MADATQAYPDAAAFHFMVRVGAPGDANETSFQEVSGISAEMETESYQEGGENRFVHHLPKGVKQQNLVLARGLAEQSSNLVEWCRQTLQNGLAQPIRTRQVDVSLLDAAGNPLRHWSFANAYPVKWQAEGFDSLKSAVAIEKIELAYSNFTRTM